MVGKVNEADWKPFRNKLPGWQENFTRRLNTEYMEILSKEGKRPSEIFWELENRLRRDRRLTGVVANLVSRSNMDTLIMSFWGEGAITLDDLVGFSEELQERMEWIVEGRHMQAREVMPPARGGKSKGSPANFLSWASTNFNLYS